MPALFKAKERIERLFKTLQGLLIKEMRLKGIEKGNAFLKRHLPLYNRKLAIQPTKGGNPSLDKGVDLAMILCRKIERTLRNGHTIRHRAKLYQIENTIQGEVILQ